MNGSNSEGVRRVLLLMRLTACGVSKAGKVAVLYLLKCPGNRSEVEYWAWESLM